MRAFVGVVMLSLLTSAPALAAGSSALYSRGGKFARFDPVVWQYNQSGEQFRIEGRCNSACTMFLSIKNVCIVRSARLGFHAAKDRQYNISASGTAHMMNTYNAKLRAYLVEKHAMETRAFTTISGSDMITKFGYRECR
jgi:hypothetical protein